MAINMFEGARQIASAIACVVVVTSLSGCGDKGTPDDLIFTLYSTNFPDDSGRHPVATFDVAAIPELNMSICQETAELYQADFERRKRENAGNSRWTNAKARHWCEKGRYRK